MKAANFLNILLAIAVVLLCAKLHFTQAPAASPVAPAAPPAAQPEAEIDAMKDGGPETDAAGTIVIDSTGLAPGVSGFAGPVPVVVELKDGVVARVEPKLPNDETPGFFKRLEEAGLWKAWDGLPAEVAATARVDAVTSATYSSEAAIANVRAALAAATGQQAEAPEQCTSGGSSRR